MPSSESFEQRAQGCPLLLSPLVGDLVRVRRNLERFWCQVQRVEACGDVVANVISYLDHNPDIAYGDAVRIGSQCILETMTIDHLVRRCERLAVCIDGRT